MRGRCALTASRPACEHVFVTFEGRPYTRFRRALQTGDPRLVRMIAAELPRIDLADALEVFRVLAAADDPAWNRAGVRWVRRLCDEAVGLELVDVALVALALERRLEAPWHEVLRGVAARHRLRRLDAVLATCGEAADRRGLP
jgi:hypothetical protein